MCPVSGPTALLAGGMAASALGNIISNRQQNSAANKAAGFAEDEADRQEGFAEQGIGEAMGSLAGFQDPDQIANFSGRDDAVRRLLASAPAPNMRVPGRASAPTAAMTNQIVQQGAAEGRGASRAEIDAKRATDGISEGNFAAGQRGVDIGLLQDRARRSSGALNAELASSAPQPSIAVDLLRGGGNMATLIGATRAPAGARTIPNVPKPNPRR